MACIFLGKGILAAADELHQRQCDIFAVDFDCRLAFDDGITIDKLFAPGLFLCRAVCMAHGDREVFIAVEVEDENIFCFGFIIEQKNRSADVNMFADRRFKLFLCAVIYRYGKLCAILGKGSASLESSAIPQLRRFQICGTGNGKYPAGKPAVR